MESRHSGLGARIGALVASMVGSSAKAANKISIVLIHGAWYDSGCWHRIVPLLKAAGHTVVAPDMPGYETNGLPNPETEFDEYVDAVVSAVNSIPGPVMLVGHGLGGIFISQAAERIPDKIASLIYISAFMLMDGESRIAVASQDPDSVALKHRISAGEGLISFTRDGFADSFCNDCSAEDAEYILTRIKPQPVKPLRTPLKLTHPNYGRVPRFYVKCTLDRGITPAFQEKMIAASPTKRILELQASHSPFMSKPQELTAALQEIAAQHPFEMDRRAEIKAATEVALLATFF